MFEAIGALILSLSAMFAREFFTRGKNEQWKTEIIKTMDEIKHDLNDAKATKEQVIRHEERMGSITRDNGKTMDSLDILNENINQNNQAIASLDATMKGVKNVLESILKGEIQIGKNKR